MSRKWRKAKPIRAAGPAAAARRDDPREFRVAAAAACTIAAAEGGDKLPTFRGVVYTGAKMRPSGWWEDVIIDLDGVIVPTQQQPALRQHDPEQVVGHTTKVEVTAAGIEIEGVFSGQPEHADKVVVPAKNGFPWQLSVGADPVRTEFLGAGEEAVVNGRKVTGPLTISRETRLGENSFVPLGADRDTSVSVAAQRGNAMNPWKEALKAMAAELRAAGAKCHTDAEIDNMSADEARGALKKYMKQARAGDDDDDDDDQDDDKDKKEKAKAKAAAAAQLKAAADGVMADLNRQVAAQHARHSAIVAACKKHGVDQVEIDGKKVSLAAHAIEHDWSPEKAELEALRAARPGPGVGLPGGLGYGTSAPQVSEAVLEAAVLQAARHQFRLEDDSFYTDPTPDGRGRTRRVPESLQRQTLAEMRARYTDQVQQQAHTLFKGRLGLHQLLATALRCNGHGGGLDLKSENGVRAALTVWGRQEQGIQAEGASNLSISNILANVLNKFALQGYLFVEQAWREIAAIKPVGDFKPTKSINLLGQAMFKALGSSGELQNASFGDQAFANQAQPYGIIATIPWQHLVNDDLGMLTGVPLKIGQGAGLALNDAFWSLWAAASLAATVNGVAAPNGDDGNAFWRTTSSTTAAAKRAGTAYLPNKATGAGTALSNTSLNQAKALFDNQIDPNGNPLGFDGAMPVLLHGPTLWQTVMQALYGEILIATGLASTSAASVAPAKNVFAGFARPVMSRYVENASYGNSATGWYLLMNPAALPAVEVAFLNGVDTPAVLQAGPDYQFDRLGISIRGTMPFGVNVQNFRGGVFMAGA